MEFARIMFSVSFKHFDSVLINKVPLLVISLSLFDHEGVIITGVLMGVNARV